MKAVAPFGFNVIGYASGHFGQAVAARNTIRALLAAGYPTRVRDVNPRHGLAGSDRTYQDLYLRRPWAQPYKVNLFQLNPPEVNHEIPRRWFMMPIERRLNAIVPFWELDVLPPAWVGQLQMMDVVLAPSLFVADVVGRAMPDLPVLHFPQAAYLPDGVKADRTRWGLSAEETVFFSSFDVTSDIHRKNPWAAVEAFLSAFQGGERTRLLIKLNNTGAAPDYAHLVDELHSVAAKDSRVTVLDEVLSYPDVLSLYAASDVLVSLHRAEGLGLVLMEAMSLGKPVIATAYSGTMDFTTAENSALVDFTLVPVKGSHPAYQDAYTGGGASWAEPDLSQAAEWMRRLAEDCGLRERLGRRAAADMEARREKHLSGETFERVRRFAETYDPSGAQHLRKASLIRRRRWSLLPRLVRTVIAFLPGLVLRACKVFTFASPELEQRRRKAYEYLMVQWPGR